MRRFLIVFALFASLAAGLPVAAQLRVPASSAKVTTAAFDAPHLRVELLVPDDDLFQDQPLNKGGLYFKLEPGWHIYWENPGDSGEPPHIHWTLPKGISAAPMQFPAPKRLPLGPLMDFGYENEVLFPFSFQVAGNVKPGPAVLHAKVDWLVCREVCIPGKADLEENVQLLRAAPKAAAVSRPDQALWDRLINALPQPLPSTDKAVFQPTSAGFRLAIDTGQRETQAAFFPEDEDILDNPAPQTLTPTSTGLILDLKKDTNLTASPARLRGVLELSGGRNYELTALPGPIAASPVAPAYSSSALVRIAGLAFLGGLLLNLMPCVFPVLFLKGLALVNSGSEERRTLRAHGFVYAAGILVSFWALVGALLSLRAAGAVLGWGFQFQSPVFLALMAGLLFLLGLSLAGQFEIGLTLTSAGGSLAAKQGYAGSFLTGVLAVVVATPCTAPFMGAAVGYALAQPAAVTFAVFTALAIGLAAPYVALTLQPAWTRLLPKPGAWMEVLKQVVSVPIFCTVIWLAWVLAQAYGAALLAVLLSSFLLLAIAGWFMGRWPARRWATVIAVLIVLVAAALDVAAPKELAAAPSNSLAELSSKGFAARSAAWQPWSAEAVERSLAAGQPVFVDFTARWCLSCQFNERVALDQPDVMQAFQARNVALFKADWTRQDPAITEALTALGRSGVPVYALYKPGQTAPQLLPQVLTPRIVVDAVGKIGR